MAEVVEFTLHAKPGHYAELLNSLSNFAREFEVVHPDLESLLIVGNEAQGFIRAIAVYANVAAAQAVNSETLFAQFNESIEPLISSAPTRELHDLISVWVRT